MTQSMDTSGWWGGQGRGHTRLTILDLIRNNTLDVDTAALLWHMVENGASIVVASSPQRAGKTTLLSALMDFVPPKYEKVYTRGIHEDFSFLNTSDPSGTYILIPEISNHMASYMWGDGLRTVFEAMAKGYSMASTMHADTPEDVIWMLDGYPMHIPHEQLSKIDAIVNIRMIYGERDIERRVNNVTMVSEGPSFSTVVEWEPATDTFARDGADAIGEAVSPKVNLLRLWLEQESKGQDEFLDLLGGYYEGNS